MFIELLNPKNDYVFKRIFGHNGNENVTKQMLSTILKRQIKDIIVSESTILERDLIDEKLGIIDIHAKIDEAIDVDIEMQVVSEKSIEKRILYYWSKLYIKSIKVGESYHKLRKAIVVLIADFELKKLKDIANFLTKWQIREENSQTVILTEMLELYIIELPKARKEIKETEKEIQAWISFLENPKNMEMVGMSKENQVAIKEAKNVLKQISEDEHERYLAHLREKYIRDQKAIEEFGYDNGLENGIKRGIEQGIKQTTIEIAKQMLKEDIEIEVIKRITKLSEQEIEKLK